MGISAIITTKLLYRGCKSVNLYIQAESLLWAKGAEEAVKEGDNNNNSSSINNNNG